jgi:hypothetical protein
LRFPFLHTLKQAPAITCAQTFPFIPHSSLFIDTIYILIENIALILNSNNNNFDLSKPAMAPLKWMKRRR